METFRLPHGGEVRMNTRDGTNDHNVCYSIITEDEYRIDDLKPMIGLALDVGAHIGAATVALCALNPDLRVVAIEALPANVALLAENVNLNGFGERVTILHAAAGTNDTINWNWAPIDKEPNVHRFIGNQHFGPGTGHETLIVNTVTLSQIVAQYGPVRFLKIDCEGCEDSFLTDPAIDQVEWIAGEFHSGPSVELRFYQP